MSMIRRGSMVLSTAPTNFPHPWKVEWNRGVNFRCYLGTVFDPTKEQWEPKRFPDALSSGIMVTNRSVSPRFFKRDQVNLAKTPFSTSVKSGSAKVYYTDDFGRATSGNSIMVDEEKGCAEWKESDIMTSARTNSVYFVLHKVDGDWTISVIEEGDLTPDDIRLAVIKKRTGASIMDWSLMQLWKSDIVEQQPMDVIHPFMVKVNGDGANGRVFVAQGDAYWVSGSWTNAYQSMGRIAGFAVYPDSSLITGTDTSGTWCSNGGAIAIKNSANGGNDSWQVCIISNNNNIASGQLTGGAPYLAVVATGSDAYSKTEPWTQYFIGVMQMIHFPRVLVAGTTDVVQTSSVEQRYISHYMCQRLIVANIYWDGSSSSWVSTQYVKSDVNFNHPYYYAGFTVDVYDQAYGSPATPPAPSYQSNQTDWEGSWSGYTKDLSNPTTIVYL